MQAYLMQDQKVLSHLKESLSQKPGVYYQAYKKQNQFFLTTQPQQMSRKQTLHIGFKQLKDKSMQFQEKCMGKISQLNHLQQKINFLNDQQQKNLQVQIIPQYQQTFINNSRKLKRDDMNLKSSSVYQKSKQKEEQKKPEIIAQQKQYLQKKKRIYSTPLRELSNMLHRVNNKINLNFNIENKSIYSKIKYVQFQPKLSEQLRQKINDIA